MQHELKIAPEWYRAHFEGKNFELRKDDRGYKVGDTLYLQEYADGKYTGRNIITTPIRYILRNCPEYGLMDGYCILGF